jgi:DNA-binding transcriptional regulator YiaG
MSGEELHRIRESWEMSQEEFAVLVGVSRQAVGSYEADERSVPGPVVVLLEILQEDPKLRQLRIARARYQVLQARSNARK